MIAEILNFSLNFPEIVIEKLEEKLGIRVSGNGNMEENNKLGVKKFIYFV